MSSGELLLTTIVTLAVFGPKKLPMLATHLARFIRQISHIKAQASTLWLQQLNQLQLQENIRKAEECDKKQG